MNEAKLGDDLLPRYQSMPASEQTGVIVKYRPVAAPAEGAAACDGRNQRVVMVHLDPMFVCNTCSRRTHGRRRRRPIFHNDAGLFGRGH